MAAAFAAGANAAAASKHGADRRARMRARSTAARRSPAQMRRPTHSCLPISIQQQAQSLVADNMIKTPAVAQCGQRIRRGHSTLLQRPRCSTLIARSGLGDDPRLKWAVRYCVVSNNKPVWGRGHLVGAEGM